MKEFAALYGAIDQTTSTTEKVAALMEYFRTAPPEDAAWAIYFLSGRRPKRLIGSRKLAAWAGEDAGLPDWLFEESYQQVGDLAETITLVLPDSRSSSELPLAHWVDRLLRLRGEDDDVQRMVMVDSWHELGRAERLVWNKLITGSFRVGASQQLVVRALARLTGVQEEVIAHRLMGSWEPGAEFFQQLIAPDTRDAEVSRPYPFFLAYPLEANPSELGDPREWIAEWKWDGIRAQLIRRSGRSFLWSRGEELLAGRFPEVEEAGSLLPDGTVLDGELLAWVDGKPLPFAQLQRRIGRKSLGRKILDEVPVVLIAYDLLELNGSDLRTLPLSERRSRLAGLLETVRSGGRLLLSPEVELTDWNVLAGLRLTAREVGAEGVMLKRRSSRYGVGRRRGDWWKWKVDPLSVDAVLIYAQPGSGKRAGLFTDYTFGVWEGEHLVPLAKAYSGLTDAEIRQVDRFVRRNTLEKFGPVRTVKPELVFELHFEGIQPSSRHKSGIAVRFPRIARWRTDKKAEEADSLETVRGLLKGGEAGSGEGRATG